MIRSLRIRLFLVATAIVAVVLAVVMASGWSRVLAFENARLDAGLCSEAARLAGGDHAAADLQRLESDMKGKLRLASEQQLLLWLASAQPQSSFQSDHWDPAIAIDALPWTLPANPNPNPNPESQAVRNDCELITFVSRGGEWRAARVVSPQARGIVAADLRAPKTEIQNSLLDALLVEIPLALVLAALGAGVLSTLMLRPVTRLREAMKALTPQELGRRLPADAEDREFKELIAAYNTMLDRLERSFLQASRFSADAAHELKTPLTILRGRIEQARRKASEPELQAELSDLLDEVARLSGITRKLLILSQADAGKLDLVLETIDLTDILTDMVADTHMVAEGRKLSAAIKPGLTVQGDTMLLQQLLNNLLSNAIRYSPADGFVDITAWRDANGITLLISNACQALTLEQRNLFFERFYRGNAVHNRDLDGNGLGLSLAREIARAHGGDLALQDGPDNVVRLQLFLPAD